MSRLSSLRVSAALGAAALLTTGACASRESAAADDSTATHAGAPAAATPSTAGGDVASAPSASTPASTPASTSGLASNQQGRIPVLEYHVIGGEKNALYTRTVASFKADLEDVYRRGYRPINMAQLIDKDFRDVPAGMSPVVFVFDDASPEQFSYVGEPGKIDPNSAVGIWQAFQRTHPDWKSRGVFCMLNGGEAGHNFFGDAPNKRYKGVQQKAWRFQKVQWLNQQGFELCAHTLWHARLDKYPDAVVQEQIARNVAGIDSAVPGYKVRSFALPYGIWPKNRSLAWAGSWTDRKSGKTFSYKFDDVMEVSGGPTRSPYDPAFNAHSVTRIEAIGDDIRKTLDRLDQGKTRFVK
jgi:peptidoglycan/xylan/chitin deacetylase (PgdA/CDA1 family)